MQGEAVPLPTVAHYSQHRIFRQQDVGFTSETDESWTKCNFLQGKSRLGNEKNSGKTLMLDSLAKTVLLVLHPSIVAILAAITKELHTDKDISYSVYWCMMKWLRCSPWDIWYAEESQLKKFSFQNDTIFCFRGIKLVAQLSC